MIEVRKQGAAPPEFGVLSDMYGKCSRMVAYRKNDGENEGEAFDLLAEIEAIYSERLTSVQEDIGQAEEAKELGTMRDWTTKLVKLRNIPENCEAPKMFSSAIGRPCGDARRFQTG